MSKTKVLLAMGIILLFVGLSVSPATAKITNTNVIGKFTEIELEEMRILMPRLMEEMSTATSCAELLTILTTFMKNCGNHPILELLIKIVREILDVMNSNGYIGSYSESS